MRAEETVFTALAAFRLARFRLLVKARTPLLLPAYKGSALRGGFGQVFRHLACLGADRGVTHCLLGDRCPYHYIFETPSPPGSVVLDKVPTAPQPFVIEPPLESKRRYEPGEELLFHLVLIGKAIDYLPYFIYTFDELGRVGLGRGKGNYTLESVAWLDETEVAIPLYDGERKILTDVFRPLTITDLSPLAISSHRHSWLPLAQSDTPVPVLPEPFAPVHPERRREAPKSKDAQDKLRASEVEGWIIPNTRATHSQITLSFLTPTRLKFENHLAGDCEFHVLFRNLTRRIALLGYFHCDGEFPPERREFVEHARAIETVTSDLRWVDWERYSNRQQNMVYMGGFVGQVTYRGDFTEFFPYLLLGTYTHVGKGATFGLGSYQLVSPSQ